MNESEESKVHHTGTSVVYLAGPMRGIEGFNFPAFDAAASVLRRGGWEVINPAEMDRESGDGVPVEPLTKAFIEKVMRRDAEQIISRAEALVLLPGWEASTGARAELALARWKGMPVFEYLAEHRGRLMLSHAAIKAHNPRAAEANNEAEQSAAPSPLPASAAERKKRPVFSGVLKYFPRALAEVAACSWIGNEQHNPGEALHWARGKSNDHGDCLVRHLLEAGTVDGDGVRHSAKAAWRALAMLELELEAAGK